MLISCKKPSLKAECLLLVHAVVAHLALKHLSDGINHYATYLALIVFPLVLVKYKLHEHLHDVLFLPPLDGKNHPLKKRNNFACKLNESSAIPSSNTVPSLAYSKNRWFHCHPLYAQTFRFPHLHPQACTVYCNEFFLTAQARKMTSFG